LTEGFQFEYDGKGHFPYEDDFKAQTFEINFRKVFPAARKQFRNVVNAMKRSGFSSSIDRFSTDVWSVDYHEGGLSIRVFTDKMSDTAGTVKKLNKLLKDIKV